MAKPVYKRVLLKVSGEALAGDKHSGLDFEVIGQVCDILKECLDMGVQVGLVIGGGNFWRGVKDGGGKMERTRADHMGMLATVLNCLAVADVCEQKGIPVRVQTAIEMRAIAEPYIRSRAIRHLEKGRVVIFGCGTGNPFFSTDTAAVLRAAEIGADVILLAKNVDRCEIRFHQLRRRAGPAPDGDGLHGHVPLHGQPYPGAAVCPEGPPEHHSGPVRGEGGHHREGVTRRCRFSQVCDMKGRNTGC